MGAAVTMSLLLSYLALQGHWTIIGLTRNGKTYTMARALRKVKEGVLFFNTQYEELEGYITIDMDTNKKVMVNMLKKGRKLNYKPSQHKIERFYELHKLIEILYEAGFSKENRVFLAVDEVHLYTGYYKPKQRIDYDLEKVATGGLRFGINALWISQRPQKINNTLMSQSFFWGIFKLGMDNLNYYKDYNIPMEDIQNRIKQRGLYSFCIFDGEKIEGAHKI